MAEDKSVSGPKHEVTVRVTADARKDVEQVAQELARRGLGDVSVSARFGMIHGVADEKAEADIRGVDGVASVKRSQTFRAV
ncbi:hypothetical protein [Salinarimonas sp.]|uniref:hypothetical protein n=1 Tax=Salinarimonas sp. TaxID=2766526 RepID=UPI0032D8F907